MVCFQWLLFHTLSLCHVSLTLFLTPCFVLFLFSFASPSLSLTRSFVFGSLAPILCLSVCCLLGICSFPFSLSLSCLMAKAFLSRGAFWADSVFARSLSRSFVSVSLALRLFVFRSLAFPLVRSFRSPCARSFFVCSLSRSFVSVSPALRPPVFRSFSFPPVRFCFARHALVSVSLALCSVVFRSLAFPARSLLSHSVVFRSLEPHPSLCPLSCAFRCSFMFLSFGAITPPLSVPPFLCI